VPLKKLLHLRKNTTVSGFRGSGALRNAVRAQLGNPWTRSSPDINRSRTAPLPPRKASGLPLDRFLKAAISNRPGNPGIVCARELGEHQLVATNFLGLAEIRVADGDVAGAVTLLKRLGHRCRRCLSEHGFIGGAVRKNGSPHGSHCVPRAACECDSVGTLVPSETQQIATPGGTGKECSGATAWQNFRPHQRIPTHFACKPPRRWQGCPAARRAWQSGVETAAGGAKNITPSASDHPLVLRIAARCGAVCAQCRDKMAILAKALADSPSREDARVPFFRAAISIPAEEFAPVLHRAVLQRKLLGPGRSGKSQRRRNNWHGRGDRCRSR